MVSAVFVISFFLVTGVGSCKNTVLVGSYPTKYFCFCFYFYFSVANTEIKKMNLFF